MVSGKLRRGLVSSAFFLVGIGNEEQDQYGGTIDCGSEPYSDNRPLRFKFIATGEFVECGWPWSHTITRMVVALLGFLLPFPVIFFGFIKKKKWVVWLSIILSLLFLLGIIVVLVFDTKELFSSLSWCNSYGLAEDCSYIPFFGLAIVEGLLVPIWLVEALFLLYYCTRFMKDDFTDFAFDYADDNSYYSS